ncbi:MAG TPA: hypothetical protein VMT20_00565, partial [Terriglobia bacterium]|nr:hypothetical protein [Terriglobia bacterium]
MGTNLSPKTPEARERQQTGQHKGLLHAAQKRKRDRSANYATNFCDGLTAFDFERSAAAAGETRKDLRGHYALLDRALLMLCGFFGRAPAALPKLPLETDTASPRAPKLVRALALLAWRPVRLFRMQERWERLAVFFRLQELIGWR